MSNETQHIDCANRTQQTIEHLLVDKSMHSPWIATTAFYKALHVVEAVFAATNDKHGASHEDRERRLKHERKFEKICRHYFPLQRSSTNARYLSGKSSFDDFISPEKVVEQLLKHHLHQLEQSAEKFLTAPDQLVGINSAFK